MSRPGIILENPRVAVAIDRQTGAGRSIHDKNLDVVYPQSGIGFEVETAAGTLRSETAAAVKATKGQAELILVPAVILILVDRTSFPVPVNGYHLGQLNLVV